MKEALAVLVLLFGIPTLAAAQAEQRSECADSFSARLVAAQALIEAFIRAHPDAPYVQVPVPGDVACEADDRMHRISLVLPPEGDPRHAIVRLELMCYGNARASCERARVAVDSYRRHRRELGLPPPK